MTGARALSVFLAFSVLLAACRAQPSQAPAAARSGAVENRPANGPASRFDADELCTGEAHSCARTSDGAVACWGDNAFHQVSTDDVPQLDAPRVVDKLPKASRLRCGRNATCVETPDGQIHCLGFRYENATRAHRDPGEDTGPVKIQLPQPARDFVLEESGGCAVLVDGRVACWHEDNPAAPFIIDGLGRADAFAVASARAPFVCVTRGDDAPACIDFAGRDPRNPAAGFPRHVSVLSGLERPRQLVLRDDVTLRVCARGTDNTIACANRSERTLAPDPLAGRQAREILATNGDLICVRQLGNIRCIGSEPSLLEANVPGELTALALSRGHACAVAHGRVVCWGQADRGQLGDGTRYAHPPEPVARIDDAVSMTTRRGVVCVGRQGKAATGRVTCWGRSDTWEPAREFAPFDIPIEGPPLEVALDKRDRPCARRSEGRSQGRFDDWSCWDGELWSPGQKDVGTVEDVFAPLGIRMRAIAPDGACGIDRTGRLGCADCPGCTRESIAWAAGNDLVEATSLIAPPGDPHQLARMVCARTKNGKVRCFKAFEHGPILDPVEMPTVAALSGVTRILAGRGESDLGGSPTRANLVCALTDIGAVHCWGDGRFGQLGPGAGGQDMVAHAGAHVVPYEAVRIDGLPPATELAVGGAFACARTRAGQIYCWGSNRGGRAPNGAPRERATPVVVRF